MSRIESVKWLRAWQLAEDYWLYVVWDLFGKSLEPVRILNPLAKLNHIKKEIVVSRFYEISAESIINSAAL